MKKVFWIAGAAMLLGLASCASVKNFVAPGPRIINLALTEEPQANRYVELDYGVRLNVRDARSNSRVLQKYDASATTLPQVQTDPEIVSFVSESTRRYMRTMGFNLDSDVATDYMLTLSVREFNLGFLSGVGWSGTVQLNVEVHDQDRKLVYPSVVAVGRASLGGNGNDFLAGARALNTAYALSLFHI